MLFKCFFCSCRPPQVSDIKIQTAICHGFRASGPVIGKSVCLSCMHARLSYPGAPSLPPSPCCPSRPSCVPRLKKTACAPPCAMHVQNINNSVKTPLVMNAMNRRTKNLTFRRYLPVVGVAKLAIKTRLRSATGASAAPGDQPASIVG